MDKKEEIPAKDYETGLDIARRYATQYLFDFYDILLHEILTTLVDRPATCERGAKDARTILHFLSKGVSVLEVVRNGLPGSMTTTYQINPPLD